MIVPILASVGSVGVGTLLAFVPVRREGLLRVLQIGAFTVALLAIASLTSAMSPVLAEADPPARAGCARTGQTHETPSETPSVHAAGQGCGQCERGCIGQGQCVTSVSLAVLEVPSPDPVRAGHPIRCDTRSEPLGSAGAAPPIPPPQPVL